MMAIGASRSSTSWAPVPAIPICSPSRRPVCSPGPTSWSTTGWSATASCDWRRPAPGGCDVGKAAGPPGMSQERINELLVELAEPGMRRRPPQGRRSLRLRPRRRGGAAPPAPRRAVRGGAGDHGGPGCAAAAMIPLTHRGVATSVRLVTGHCREGWWLDLDWRSLADSADHARVLHGLGHLEEITGRLIEAGLPRCTPAARHRGRDDRRRSGWCGRRSPRSSRQSARQGWHRRCCS